MLKPRIALMAALVAAILGSGSPAMAGMNTIGRQSQNEGITAVPAPEKVTVDGDLSEWDWSGRVCVFADYGMRGRYSVEAAAMWDKDHLYLGAKWKDPMPLNSAVDPSINPDEGWKADSWQMRVHTDHNLWITTWHYPVKKQSVMHFAHWKDDRGDKLGIDARLMVSKEGATELGDGAEMAYKLDADGKGFSQEIRIPWKLLYRAVPEIKEGLTLRMGCEFLWGDATGRTWPIHRYADNMQPGKTSREFYWTAVSSWGDITLSGKGKLTPREYAVDAEKVMGTIPVRVDIPRDASRFTILIEDQQGKSVRTLVADSDPADYAVKGTERDGMRTVEVLWDGLTDFGKLARPGTFKARGLTHKGLSTEYEMCFYNPGTPPWQTKDGSGAWGADHSGPIGVAATGDWTTVCFECPEGGSGVIGIDPEGRKRWGDRRGARRLAGDDNHVYAYVTNWYTKETICRYERKTGKTTPFVLDGKDRTFDLTLKEILGDENPGGLTGMAARGGKLAAALASGRIVILDAASASVQKSFPANNPGDLAFSKDGILYGVVDGKVRAIDTASGAMTPVPLPGVEKITGLAVDNDGNLVIADVGPDSQMKAFSPDGKAVYSCGKKGGRPLTGPFDRQGMVRMSSVAVDAKGQVWVTELWDFPRRVSVWGRDGALVRDYIGNAYYAGSTCWLHDQDPALGYVGPVEINLNKERNEWQVSRVLWLNHEFTGKPINMAGGHALGHRFSSSVSGGRHEYLYLHDTDYEWGTGHVVLMERGGEWRAVATVALAGHLSGKITRRDGLVAEPPSGELAGLNAYDVVVWNDLDKDGVIQRAECAVIPADKPGDAKKRGEPALHLQNGWGGRLGDDLSIYTGGILRWKPIRYADGAPVYSPDSRIELGPQERMERDLVPVWGENKLISLNWGGSPMPTLSMLDLRSGAVEWSYPNPYPGVHGSHNATMPKPGLLIGPLKTCGVAKVSEQVGSVFLLRGNLGQDFIFTTDGLYVGAMFQDGRLPCDSLPETERMLKGMPMDNLTEGGEPFNGWFGKQADGKIRLTTGMAREACMILQVNGLETIRRFDGGQITVDMPTIVKADQDNAARAAKKEEARTYVVKPVAKPPSLDGKLDTWKDIQTMAVGREGLPDRAECRLSYDADNLYACFTVSDSTPWKNEGKDMARLFKTGDAVDLQLDVRPDAKKHATPEEGDLRVVFSQLEGKPVAVVMAPVDKKAPPQARKSYTSPVGTKLFDRVEIIADAKVSVKAEGNRYIVQAALPLKSIGLSPRPGMKIRGDVGFISSDANGLINTARTYWANKQTNLVNDEPLESWLYPDRWGEITFE